MRQEKNPTTGEDLKKKALEIAEAKLQKNIADKPLEGSTDVRTETGTATNIRQATTPAEIEAWKKSIGQPGAGRFNKTETATATAQGADQTKPKEEPKEEIAEQSKEESKEEIAEEAKEDIIEAPKEDAKEDAKGEVPVYE
jgi:hypothetical protein